MIIEVLKGSDFIAKFFGYESKTTKRIKALEERINVLEDRIANLENSAAEFKNNRKQDREQSFRIQDTLLTQLSNVVEDLKETNESILSISNRINENEEKRRSSERARLKDRIGQIYRHYHSIKEWNTMEKEALEDLINEYENAGGENSFVHSVVQKEMYTWKEI